MALPRISENCLVDGCGNPYSARGYCRTHYSRHKRGSSLDKPIVIRNPNKLTTCIVPGCNGKYESLNYCKIHYQRFSRGADLNKPIIPNNPKYKSTDRCIFRSCNGKAAVKFLCSNHNAIIWKHKITSDQYIKMHEEQNYKCAICKNYPKTTKSLCIDHNHETGYLRSLLCDPCNTMIGLAKEDPEILQAAIEYLKFYQEAPFELIEA